MFLWFTTKKDFRIWKSQIKEIVFLKLSLGEYGRQRTSKKFHDLVLDLWLQNSRVLETSCF